MIPQGLLIALFLCFSFFAEGQIHYVKVDGTGDGSSWANASGNLQEVFDNMAWTDTVWVAAGTYYPVICTNCTEAQQASYFSVAGVMLGGFPNVGNPTMDNRDWENNPTILSGNIGDPNSSLDNVDYVVNGECDFIDGFTISDAKIDGLNIDESSAIFVNCRIINNQRYGVFLDEGGVLRLTNCLVSNNGSTGVRGKYVDIHLTGCEVSNNQGGGVVGSESGEMHLENCLIANNIGKGLSTYAMDVFLDHCRFSNNAGGIMNIGGRLNMQGNYSTRDLYFDHCIFENNGTADNDRGGIKADYIYGKNSLFVGNIAEKGGAIFGLLSVDISNCTFVNNSATLEGAAIYGTEGEYNFSSLKVSNSIFWGNHSTQSAKAIDVEETTVTVDIAYNLMDVPDCDSLGTNISCGDGNIFSANDPFLSIIDEDFQLSDTSQAINAGYNDFVVLGSYDLNGQHRIQNSIVDIGAYEQEHCVLSFTNQTAIDDFLINNPNLDTLDCDVYIHSEGQDTIFNLNGFNEVRKIGGFLWIDKNNSITSLAGLESLSEISGYLKVNENQSLTNLDALSNLTSINSSCAIYNNENLVSIADFDNLLLVGGDFIIDNNNSLTSIADLDGLEMITNDLEITNNKNLASVNAFNGLLEVGGDLLLNRNDSLHTFVGFNNLNRIERDLELSWNPNLSLLADFDNLSEVGGSLDISVSRLANLNGLNDLAVIGGRVNISSNGSLGVINGFQSVANVGSAFDIRYNSTLDSIEGFNNLTSVGAFVRLEYSNNITSINGFQNLDSVGGDFLIRSTALTDFQGLSSLTFVGGDLTIISNQNLSSLNGLQSLNAISTYLNLSNNNALVSLLGLDNVETAGMTNLYLLNNDLLEFCSESFVCNYLLTGGPSNISNNAPGCNSDLEILFTCDEVGKIHYSLFYDVNENGSLDNDEPFLSGASVLIEPGACTSYGNPTNGGIKFLPFGDYTISYNQNNTPIWELTSSPNFFNFSLSEQNNSDTIYFALRPTESISEVETGLVNGLPRCNEFVTFSAIANNNGTTIADGTFWFVMDENVLGANFIDPPDTIVAPNRYGWYFTDFYPEAVLKKEISIQLPGPPDFPIGDLLNFKTEINYSDVNGSDGFDEYQHSIEVQCSYDPNDKLVSPIYPDNYALIGEDLVYTIRFQNTGNAEAYDVVITDELDSNLDLSTFQYITSSHESVLSTFLEGHMLTFEFRDIFLPDSTTNFDESQGYVMYSIRANSDIEENTSVENTANIFFDYNPAVITNTTENVMLSTFDFDGDGFFFFEDCDDDNPLVNPDMTEIPFNGLDDDCNEATLDDDFDQDGFALAEDCDDNNPNVNPNATEIPYNGIDEDCNPETFDQDLDQDGFLLADDCDDNNPLVNPGVVEIPYNDVDDDCDEATLDDDLDQDGFLLTNDCDDEDPAINTAAEEIPNNGIDEDCDGEDLIVSIKDMPTTEPNVFPNPTTGILQVVFPESVRGMFELRDLHGKLLLHGELSQQIFLNLETQAQGLYLLFIKTEGGVWSKRVVKI